MEHEDAGVAAYPWLEATGDHAKRVIETLERIRIDDISFKRLTPAEAIAYLTGKVAGEKGGGVINFVVRGAEPDKKVGITGRTLNFAQAVDEICGQAGRVWTIDFNEKSGTPILVIKTQKSQKGPGGRAGEGRDLPGTE